MIPLKLQIKNFLSYGSPTQQIDFAPYHLICLSGKNGHGKSAMLDALTWAVWGQARKTIGNSKADEGLLRLGQTNMMVSLDFLSNGQLYRVRREYTHDRGKGVAQLDFGIIDKETERLRPLTDKTIRATQAKIEETIGLDFDSFINSVFLRQGNSNEFSKKSPKERKEILATILGLAKFELLRKRALEKIRDGGITTAHLTRLCEHLTQDTEQVTQIQEQVTTLNAQYALLLEQEKTLKEELKSLLAQRKGLHEQQQEQQRIIFSLEQLNNTLTQHEQTLNTTFATYRTITKQQRALGHTQLSTASQQQLEQELQAIQEMVSKRLQVTQEIMAVTTQQQQQAQVLQQEQTRLQQECAQQCHMHEARHASLLAEGRALETTQFQIQEELERVSKEQQALTPLINSYKQQEAVVTKEEALFERRKSFYHKFVSKGNQLAQELKQIKHKQQLAHDEDNPSCSLCEQNLSASRRRFLQTKFIAQEQLMQHQINRLTVVLASLKQILTEQHKQLELLRAGMNQIQQAKLKADDFVRTQARLQTNAAVEKQKLTLTQEQIKIYAQEVEAAQKKLAVATVPHEELLKKDVAYLELVVKHKALEQQLAVYAYNQARHDQVKEELALLQKLANSHAELMHQTALQPQRKQDIHQLCNTMRQLRQTARVLGEQLKKYEPLMQSLANCDAQEQELTVKTGVLAQDKELIAHKKGALEQESIRLEKQKATLVVEQAQLKQLETDIEEYQILAQALSKDGIQGLLIEHVLPEIEQEANNLLSKLTNNQAHLMIESVRDLKSGGSKETLDIKISDAMGIRPYELFSGGEAFRIDFALRLAISKLLARRNGTSLQTLIIDEGFGSQDEEGLGHIMESLYAIQEDFAKIIIVSHLPSMKEQFPTHFYVSKGPRGSVVQVIEQG